MRPVAAIDIGTNSTNLLIVSPAGRRFRSETPRLGQGVHHARGLAPDAVERTVAVLTRYRREIEAAGVHDLVAVTTSAARDARNREEFLDAAERALGRRPVVLSGADEGHLAYLGATADLPPDVARPLLLVDIGGGSTELVTRGADGGALVAVSIDVGCVRLTEAELHGDPPRAHELTNAIAAVQDHLDDVLRDAPSVLDTASVVGVGGTITTAAAIEIGALDHDRIHQFRLSRAAAEDVFRTVATERLEDRVHNPGLPAERAPVIVGGMCILVALMRRLHLDEIVVSQRTLLDGICADLAAGGRGVPGPDVQP